MWCCKLHLHARWAIISLAELCKKQSIDTEFTNHETFFQYLAGDCEKETLTYLSWLGIPNNKTLCEDISNKWGDLKENLKCTSNNEQKIFFTRLQKVETKPKK